MAVDESEGFTRIEGRFQAMRRACGRFAWAQPSRSTPRGPRQNEPALPGWAENKPFERPVFIDVGEMIGCEAAAANVSTRSMANLSA